MLQCCLSYNCDGGFVGINELLIDNSRSIIFPNPFSNSAILKTTIELNDATLKVFDILGQEVLILGHLNGQEIKIIKDNLNRGNYYYHLTQNGNLVSKGKFIVE
ncbi:MAG: T9SS type A sorting domain-containing protein [Bacteroidetes bacterium]|nr:T9SS type A sorting domain-containing protein [Bacteroidota bacterium]